MKKLLIGSIAFALLASLNANASGSLKKLVSVNTYVKYCGSSGVYVGPNKSWEHGGTCIYYAQESIDQFGQIIYIPDTSRAVPIYTSYTTNTNSCSANSGVYAGPWKAHEHGGNCLYGHSIKATKTRNRQDCVGNSTYAGPFKDYEHGGYCIELK